MLAPKVAGAWNLHQLTQALSLDFFVLYSSVASLLGSPGQGNYAAANAYLDALAHHRRSRGQPGLSINWGAWSEVGAAARQGVLAQAADRGLGVIDPAAGLAALERVIGLGQAQVAVLPADWPRLAQQSGKTPAFLNRLVRPRKSREAAELLPARMQAAAPAERPELLVEHVQRQVARVLGRDAGPLPDRRSGFFELGMDSLMAVELRSLLQADLGELSLSASAVFDHPTAEALAAHLAEKLPDLAAVAPATSSALVGLAAELEQLSADELLRLMDREVSGILGKDGQP